MTVKYYEMSWEEVLYRLECVDLHKHTIYGIPRGGMIVSAFLKCAKVTHDPSEATLFLDDIIDSGSTRDKWKQLYPDTEFYALVDKVNDKTDKNLGWIVFPWETQKEVNENDYLIRLLQVYGKEVNQENINKVIENIKKI